MISVAMAPSRMVIVVKYPKDMEIDGKASNPSRKIPGRKINVKT
jgi:hypothetical protein